jgi:hypothetical protein
MTVHPSYRPGEVFDHLRSLAEPVMEADLLKKFSSLDRLPHETGELFRHHFTLYHMLYSHKLSLARTGLYLHLDPMRVRLVPYPPQGSCFHYDAQRGAFCAARCSGPYCPAHEGRYRADSARPAFDLLCDFYSNEENISFGESRLLERLMKGVMVYAFRKGEIDYALKVFGITDPSKKKIAERYRVLALRHHPDRNRGDDSRMKELNRAYQVLREVYLL